ncbi:MULTISPECIES: hypothetical protein [unclassified Nocardioides]|uniref:hypothetical protein n=1 Tax=unclassified Nocardioides TaxID=2615069 RepID=UPI00114D95CB|nr:MULTISPECIES: hypothetical protein [unclassified Nocardioides]TQK68551.1 hypothetical protein FBY23_0304 [Nocardioides sp. SLBN-35]WGY02153.1 hypothetical protein QI633_26925 [Nocardioides sp. QY071]
MNPSRNSRTAALAGALVLSLGALAACGVEDEAPVKATPGAGSGTTGTATDPAIAARAAVTYLLDCVGEPVASPASVTVACADGNQSLTDLAWSDWGADEATAIGKLVANNCDPSCAEGTDVTVPAKVVVSDIVEGEASATYGTITITVEGKVPEGMLATQTYPLQTVDPVEPELGPGS